MASPRWALVSLDAGFSSVLQEECEVNGARMFGAVGEMTRVVTGTSCESVASQSTD